MTKEYKRYIIRRHNAVACLDSIGWKVGISNQEVAKNLFHKDCKVDAYLAILIDGKPGCFEPCLENITYTIFDEEWLECPVTSTTYEIGSIR